MLVKGKKFYYKFLNHLLSEMGLFTMHNFCISCLLHFLKPLIEFKSRLPIPEFFWLSLYFLFYHF